MKKFMCENFLLENEMSEILYHRYSKECPIIDYHCHINPREIFEDKIFENITQVWLYGDHYKWRQMRSFGIEEYYITGDASDYEKFLAWAKTLSYAIGNPLYHWTHLELKRYFDIHEPLNEKSASKIWEKANALLKTREFSVRKLIQRSNVEIVCTTDDPVDSLEYHIALKESFKEVKVLPAFRPDKALAIQKKSFLTWLTQLENISKSKITNFETYLKVLEKRVEFFHSVGCRISDNALDYVPSSQSMNVCVDEIFVKALQGVEISIKEEQEFRIFMLQFFAKLYCKYNWTMQFHMNCIRDNNETMLKTLGPDVGFDAMNDSNIAKPLSLLLSRLQRNNALPRTILYSLNPKDNATIGTLMGCFQEGGVSGKIQFGSAWWFNDHKLGMQEQIHSLANLGMLSTFVGMLTDSRSFLSYTRHEYFRRILCNVIGKWVVEGEFPEDIELLEDIVKNISYFNAKKYFEM